MLRCAVVDDELLAREVLETYLRRLGYIQSVRLFRNAAEAQTYLEKHVVDVLFLDIEMPGLNGIDFLKSLTDPPITVFTTAYRNYAFEGFELGVIDFLLKPIAYPRFVQAVEKVRDFLRLKEQPTALETSSGEVPSDTGHPNSIFIKSGVQRLRLNLDEVTYIQGLKDYAIIHTLSGRIVVKGSIKAMQTLFDPARFLRVHKSFMVAASLVTRLERNRLLVNGQFIPVGRHYKDELTNRLLKRQT